MIDVFSLNWYRMDNKLPKFLVPKKIKDWLIDNSSLTTKLKKLYNNFNIQVIAENIIKIDKSIVNYSEVIQREVKLCAGDKELIYAISFIPLNCKELQNIGNNPLGEIMFKNATRKSIEITKTHNNIWGRRSTFIYKEHKIMVCEFFTRLSNER